MRGTPYADQRYAVPAGAASRSVLSLFEGSSEAARPRPTHQGPPRATYLNDLHAWLYWYFRDVQHSTHGHALTTANKFPLEHAWFLDNAADEELVVTLFEGIYGNTMLAADIVAKLRELPEGTSKFSVISRAGIVNVVLIC